MPKKGKQGKKGGKGKKGKNEEKTRKKETVEKLAAANEKVFCARISLLEQSREEYIAAATRLSEQNKELHGDRSTFEDHIAKIYSRLRSDENEKDIKISALTDERGELIVQHGKEKQAIIGDLNNQIEDLEEQLTRKTNEVQLMKNELKIVREFRRKRDQIEKDLEDIRELLSTTKQEHKDACSKLDEKFRAEKEKLQDEANKKMSALAEEAHTKAVSNLDEGSRSIYKENVRLNEALKYHRRKCEKMEKKYSEMAENMKALRSDTEVQDVTIKERVAENRKLKEYISKINTKIEALERSLAKSIVRFEDEKSHMLTTATTESASTQTELQKLEHLIRLKATELERMRRLARGVLLKRNQLEQFFYNALAKVKTEIANAEGMPLSKISVDGFDWKQRERVLRCIFAQMNGSEIYPDAHLERLHSLAEEPADPMQAIDILNLEDMAIQDAEEEFEDHTFVTQAAPTI